LHHSLPRKWPIKDSPISAKKYLEPIVNTRTIIDHKAIQVALHESFIAAIHGENN